jgi:hypothetical protein
MAWSSNNSYIVAIEMKMPPTIMLVSGTIPLMAERR